MGSNYLPSPAERINPSLARWLKQTSDIMQMLRVAVPGQVQAFYPGPPAAVDVVPSINENVLSGTGDRGQLSISTASTQLPLLSHIPLFVYGAGGWSITQPVQQGDECIVLFCDLAIDVWFQNGGLKNRTSSSRRHSLSDGIAIAGLRSTPRGLENYSTGSLQIRSDDSSVVIDLASAGITVTSPKVTINTTGDIDLNASGSVTISGSSSVSISHNTTIDGVGFLGHTHTDGNAGGPTGPVIT